MAIALVTNVASGTDSGGTTSAGIDTTGANLIVAHISFSSGTTPTFSDSKGNTWTALTTRDAPASISGKLYYCVGSITVGSAHTFTISGANSFSSLFVEAFSGADAFDQESGAGGNEGTVQPGSLTPPSDGAVFVCGLNQSDSATATIDSSFTKTNSLDLSGGNYFGGAIAYLIQATAAAVNPTWSISGGNWTTEMATFTEAAAAGGSTRSRFLPTLGVA